MGASRNNKGSGISFHVLFPPGSSFIHSISPPSPSPDKYELGRCNCVLLLSTKPPGSSPPPQLFSTSYCGLWGWRTCSRGTEIRPRRESRLSGTPSPPGPCQPHTVVAPLPAYSGLETKSQGRGRDRPPSPYPGSSGEGFVFPPWHSHPPLHMATRVSFTRHITSDHDLQQLPGHRD